jgi:hypothetical protein
MPLFADLKSILGPVGSQASCSNDGERKAGSIEFLQTTDAMPP